MNKGKYKQNPVWILVNDPKFTERCANRDKELIGQIQSLRIKSLEVLGEMAREAFAHSTDQRVGKFVRALAAAMTELAVGDIISTIFSHCELPAER